MHSTSKKTVAIAIPLSKRTELTPGEQISLQHLIRYLGHYDKFFVAPEGLTLDVPGFDYRWFDADKYFGSAKAHNRLMTSERFYRAFSDYQFVLNYHLDALVFSDQLLFWCEKNFDYIGAPWIKHPDAPYAGDRSQEGLVGNGGFSLRKVDSFLRVLRSTAYQIDPEAYWNRYYRGKPLFTRLLNYPKKMVKRIRKWNNVKKEVAAYGFNEEHFWVHRAGHYIPEFHIATVDEALPFAFECMPRYCFEKNNRSLPFGCHAWEKYDRSFWEQFIRQSNVEPHPSCAPSLRAGN